MSDAEYITVRAQQEFSAAVCASDARVRQIHFQLADAYAFRLREMKRMATPPVASLAMETAA